MWNYGEPKRNLHIGTNYPSHRNPYTNNLQNNNLYEEGPWAGILENNDFAVLSTYHIMLQDTHRNMEFELDMILNNPIIEY